MGSEYSLAWKECSHLTDELCGDFFNRLKGSPSSSVQGDAFLESSIWRFATGADECESLFAEE